MNKQTQSQKMDKPIYNHAIDINIKNLVLGTLLVSLT
jgi:hypothetical protein